MTSPGGNIVEIRVVTKDQSAPGLNAATANVKKLAAAVDGGAGSASAALDSAEKKAKGLGSVLGNVGTIAGGILAADIIREGSQRVMAFAHQTIEAASSLGESLNAVDKTFGASAKTIHDWAESNAASFGLSQRAFNESATPLGAMLKNQGLTMDQVTEQTIKLTKRSADMASVFNVNVSEALVAIQAGLRGEADPLERFGVGLSAVAVEARALSDTGKTSAAQLTQQEKALARLNLIYEQTATTAGDFADTSTGLANAQRIATAEMEDAQAKIGATFLPVMAAAAQVSGRLAESVGNLPGPVSSVGAAIAIAGAGLLVFAPRVMATKEALDKMSESQSVVTRGAGRLATAVGKGAGVFAALQIATVALGSAMDTDAHPKIVQLTKDLERLGQTGQASGELTRLFGNDLGQLQKDFHALGSGFQDSTARGVSTFFNSIADFDSLSSGSLTNMRKRIDAIDQSLAGMVQSGHAEEAAAAFDKLAYLAHLSGISLDDLKNGLPGYEAAISAAGDATAAAGAAAAGAVESTDALIERYHKLIGNAFGVEAAEDQAADSIASLTDQLKKQVEAGDEGARSLTGNSEAARKNRDAVRGLVDDYENLIQQNFAAGRSTDGLAKELEDQLVAMGFSRDEAARYTGQIGELGAALQRLPPVTTAEVVLRLQTQETQRENNRQYKASGGIQGAATGGPRGNQVWTGEHGPELLDLPPGTMVHSNPDSMRMAGMGGGRLELVVSLDPSIGGQQRDLAEVLTKLLRYQVRINGSEVIGIPSSDSTN